MKNLAIFLLGALAATVLWFSIGYLQVNNDKMGKLLQHDEVVVEEAFTEAEPAVEEIVAQPEPEKAVSSAQPSIIGRWRIADPVGFEEQERMLQMDEYGNLKDYRDVTFGSSSDYTYTIEGDKLTYSNTISRGSFQFKLSSVNGKDYLEIFNNTKFGGKWIRSK